MLAWTLMCPTPPPAVTGHTSQPWQRAENRLLRESLTLGLLTGECFSSSTETACPATLHPPSQSCVLLGILPEISVSSRHLCQPPGHPLRHPCIHPGTRRQQRANHTQYKSLAFSGLPQPHQARVNIPSSFGAGDMSQLVGGGQAPGT